MWHALRAGIAVLVAVAGAGCVDAPTPQQPATIEHEAHAEPGSTSSPRLGPAGWRAYTLVVDPPETRMVIEGPDSFVETVASGEPIGFSPDGENLLFVAPSPSGLMSVYVLRIVPPEVPAQLTNVDRSIRSGSDPRAIPIPLSPDDVEWTGSVVEYRVPTIDGTERIRIDVATGEVTRE